MPDIPRRQSFMSPENMGESWANIHCLGVFVLRLLCRKTHQNFSQNSSEFVTTCPVDEILVAMYRAMRLRFGYEVESCDASSMQNVKNRNLAKQRPVFFLFCLGHAQLEQAKPKLDPRVRPRGDRPRDPPREHPRGLTFPVLNPSSFWTFSVAPH